MSTTVNGWHVVEAIVWQRDDGQRASIYGAVPWVSDAEAKRWARVSVGWTVRNPNTNEVGVGRPPEPTAEAAAVLAARLGRPSAICIGD